MTKHEGHGAPRGHERDAVNSRALGLWVFGLIVVLVLTLLLMWALALFFRRGREPDNVGGTFHGPKIAAYPATDSPISQLASARQAQEQRLVEYAWVDRENGIARIPIDDAMKILVERGLPVRTSSEKTP